MQMLSQWDSHKFHFAGKYDRFFVELLALAFAQNRAFAHSC
ncbi:hypothetical protein RLDS_18275 [Sphingobium lactosutens DS20]|uniref:Uncharacterized protein n=1 Tax=Sphingobium lactosutens DS20 TaxID=1331060 RepID=T0ILT0_9SPHN|nr:hypothetical protein RLDS_18275 [Sphingobium lactosutens DS20]